MEGEQMDAAQMFLEQEDMKMRIIALEEEVSSLRGAARLSLEEVSCYQELKEHTTPLLRATPTKVHIDTLHRPTQVGGIWKYRY